jgi:arylsulfatase A
LRDITFELKEFFWNSALDFDACARYLNLWLVSTLIIASAVIAISEETSRPNFVILFADNLGYADISLFGAPTAQTPNIDRLGIEGIKLNNWNSAAHLCSASRASLLTGKYAVRTGVYPGVFKPDAVHGMLPSEMTIAEYLKEEGYATSIVGKWHLGHRPEFLPTNQGFDEWLGIPYHMSGGSLDNHTCAFDRTEEMREQTPFFLYLPFSHVHQLCAPRDQPEQQTCQWSASGVASFTDAVEEMDWIAGQVLEALDEAGVADDTLVLFTSDNGPWVAEQSCSGFKGPFEGRW